MADLVRSMTPARLADHLRRTGDRKVTEIETQDDVLLFRYLDKDNDRVRTFVHILNGERLTAALIIRVPDSHFVSAMVAASVYTNDANSAGTYGYARPLDDDECAMVLESQVDLGGGVSEDFLVRWLTRFLDHINVFEEVMMGVTNEIGPDKEFMKGGIMDSIKEGVFEGLIETVIGKFTGG